MFAKMWAALDHDWASSTRPGPFGQPTSTDLGAFAPKVDHAKT